eukprot:COSAG02_NODE_10307_length_1974_cov_1.388800_2_plen_166_part_01
MQHPSYLPYIHLRSVVGLLFVGFAAWSFANFGQMVKQRVGERDWFMRHPDAFQKSARLNFLFLAAFAVLLFLAAVLMLFEKDKAMGFMEWFLDIGFDDDPGKAIFHLRSEWIGTHCAMEENANEPSCDELISDDKWKDWFFRDHFTVAGMCTLGLCAMVAVWAYCV